MRDHIISIFYPWLVQEGLLFQYMGLIGNDLTNHIDSQINRVISFNILVYSEDPLNVNYKVFMTHICKNYLFDKINVFESGKRTASERWNTYYNNVLYMEKLGQDFEITKLDMNEKD